MKTNKKLEVILTQIEKIIRKAEKLEVEYTDILNDIHSEYRESSFNFAIRGSPILPILKDM